MPLISELHDCGNDECERQTFYYKEVFVPYPEKIKVGQRVAKGKVARVYLCPDHYEVPRGSYTMGTGVDRCVFDE